LSIVLLLLGLAGLQLLGVVIDVIRHALDGSQRAPTYPFGWHPPASWTPIQIVTGLSLAIVAQAVLRAVLTYQYNMTNSPIKRRENCSGFAGSGVCAAATIEFSIFDVHGSSSIFNRVTGDVQNTRLLC